MVESRSLGDFERVRQLELPGNSGQSLKVKAVVAFAT